MLDVADQRWRHHRPGDSAAPRLSIGQPDGTQRWQRYQHSPVWGTRPETPRQSPWKLWPQRSELDQWSVWTWSGAWGCSTPSCRPPWGGTWTRARRCTTCRCSLSSSQTSSLINTVSLKCNKCLIRLCELPKLKSWVDYVSVMPMSQQFELMLGSK